MKGGIFISTKDVQMLLGCDSYKTANVHLNAVKDALKKRSRLLTIKEFCDYEELDFEYVWNFLRGKNQP